MMNDEQTNKQANDDRYLCFDGSYGMDGTASREPAENSYLPSIIEFPY